MHSSNQPKTLILGLGNDLLKDDGIGLRVAAGVREHLAGREDVEVVQTSEMGLALLDLVVGFDNLVIIDAIQTKNAAPGFLHEITAEDLPSVPAVSPHFLGITETLALGKKLGLSVPTQVKVFAIEVEDPFTVGMKMTPALETALPDLVERIISAVLG